MNLLISSILPPPIAKQEPVQAVEVVAVSSPKIQPLFNLVYALILDYIESGDGQRPRKETAEVISKYGPAAVRAFQESLPNLDTAVKQALLGGKSKTAALYTLGGDFKQAWANVSKESAGLTYQDLEIFKALGAYLRSDSEAALRKLKRMASQGTTSTYLRSKFAPSAGEMVSQDGPREALEKLLLRLVGRRDITMTVDESNVVKDTSPDQYKLYLSSRRQFNQSWKDFVVSYIRNSGHDHVPYPEVLAALDEAGLTHLLTRGFTGDIDDLGRLYSEQGKLISGAPNAVTFPSVKMNPNYGEAFGGDWVMQAIRVDGTDGPYYYTDEFVKRQAKKKFEKVADLSSKMEGIRKKWLGELRKFDEAQPNTVVAAILEMLYTFSARIGSMGNSTGGSSTYGISTVLVKHARVDVTGNIILRYPGKAGVVAKHVITKNGDLPMKMLHKAVSILLEGKSPKDPIFTYQLKNGDRKYIPSARINGHFRSLGAGEVSVHKIRTYHGTKLFNELLTAFRAKGKAPKTERDMLELVKKLATEVGKKLNHMKTLASGGTKVTGATALASYIDPGSVAAVFREYGFRPPRFLEGKA